MSRIEAEQIFVYGGVVDLRKGPDSLRALVGRPEPQAWYVFSNRTRELLKFLSVDESGVWCGTRRLHHRRFAWPESPAGGPENGVRPKNVNLQVSPSLPPAKDSHFAVGFR